MSKIAYKVAGHQDSMVKASLPDDYITEYIDADKLQSLDGWQVEDTNFFFDMLAENESKLSQFQDSQKQAQQQIKEEASKISSLADFKLELENMKKRQAEIEAIIYNELENK